MKRFCRAIVEVFGERYLRSPTPNDVARLLHIGEQRGFTGMLGSLDCMHWKWKNCPTAWAGQYAGRSGSPTIILEAVADYDLWIWHAYFADGIYPKWSTIVQTIRDPHSQQKKYFAMKQESCRKDVERAFGVLQSRFAIIAGPSRFWRKEVLHDIMTTCIILHNMIIEDERDLNAPIQDAVEAPTPTIEMVIDENLRFEQFLARHKKIKDKNVHFELRNALIEHLWEQRNNFEN
ncbi:hypothetical protein R3W88_000905 [Solanum pinnatisectum]|uniref:Nuclease HARBI1 n=1 Tax=Solanum pinnatisectum TaxID=50273 RepID=A0AAV9MH96_9SOLN|nr:hypothetical protein R3W88_000905 [Solanum pinnatisectum]